MDPSTLRIERKIGVSTVLLFLLSWGIFLIGINAFVLVAWWLAVMGTVVPTPEALVTLTSMPVPSWLLVGASAIQFAGMFVITILGVFLVGRVRRQSLKEVRSRRTLFSEQMGLNRAKTLAWTAAIAGGLSVGWLPGWIALWIRTHLPWMDFGAVSSVANSVTSGNQTTQWVMIFLVVVAAPIVEELLFRGWLWSAFSRWLPSWGVILVTSVLFGAFHLDPAQGIPLVLTGVFLGWVRMTTGSVGPCIAAHIANNGFAIYMAHQAPWHPAVAFSGSPSS